MIINQLETKGLLSIITGADYDLLFSPHKMYFEPEEDAVVAGWLFEGIGRRYTQGFVIRPGSLTYWNAISGNRETDTREWLPHKKWCQDEWASLFGRVLESTHWKPSPHGYPYDYQEERKIAFSKLYEWRHSLGILFDDP